MEEHLTDHAPGAPAEPSSDGDGATRVALFDLALAVAAVPLLWWLTTFHDVPKLTVGPLLLVAGLFLVAEWFPIDVELREETHTFAFTAVPLIIGLSTLPPSVVIGARALTSLVVLAGVQRQSPLKLGTNVVSHAVQVAVGAAVIVPFAGHGASDPRRWLVVALGVMAAELTGTALVTAVITLFEGRFDRELLSGALTGWIALVPDVALGLIAAILIEVRPASAVLALGIGVCLIAALRAYAVVTARYRVLEVLDSFTDELGTAVLDDRLHTELLGQLRDRLHADSAWIEVIGDGPGRLELPGGSDHLVATELPAGADDLRERARGGAVALAGSHRTGDGIVGIVKVGDDRLLVGVADRRGEVRSFDHEDVRLFDVLVAHASVALQNVRLVDQLRTEVRANEDLATLDQLTGLPNRTLFTRRLDDARSSGSPVAVLLLGIDRFKDVNDTLGHQAGDELLVAIGGRLAAATGPDSVVARLGGDEFAVLWWGLPEDEAVVRSHGVIDAVDGLYPVMGIEIDVSAAGGLATQGTQQTTAVALLRCADVARYLAKEARSSLEVYSPDRDTYSPARLAMAGRLRSAIDAGELTLHYQPQLDMATQQVVGAEALIRWMPPGRPPVSPVDLIEVAERTGLIRPLTQFVLREAVGQAARWAAMGMPLRVSANLSARNLTDEGLVEQLAALLAEHDLSPSLFEVEVTETSVMADPAASVAALRAIHALGVNISVDDFGTGHSSLAYLTQLPVDQLKIDMSFVQVLGQGDAPTAVVGAIVDLGRRLGLEVIAEGVETAGNVEVLRGLGCHLAQGYFYSRPLAVPAFEDWFATHTGATPQPAARPAVAPPGARRHPTPA